MSKVQLDEKLVELSKAVAKIEYMAECESPNFGLEVSVRSHPLPWQ